MVFLKKNQQKFPWANLLDAIPVVNTSAEISYTEKGTALLRIPLRRPRYLIPPVTWIFPISSHRRIALDTIGTFVFKLCDGKKTIEQIIERFAWQYKLSFHEARVPVLHFLRQLTERGAIVIVGPPSEPLSTPSNLNTLSHGTQSDEVKDIYSN
jgi:hypothetical protein